MYENIGTSVTEKANNCTGTIDGAARWVPGIANNNGAALYFNGSTAMYAADNATLDLTSTGGVSLWFNSKAANTGKWLLRKGAVATTINKDWRGNIISTSTTNITDGYGLYIDSSGFLRCRLRYGTADANYIEVVSTTKPNQNSWYHVAATWDGTSLKLYVNGTAEGTVATSGLTAQNSSDMFFLGASKTVLTTNVYKKNGSFNYSTTTTSYDGFTGIIDDVYLYMQLLTQANVTALATGKP